MPCTILELTQPAPRIDGPDVPPEVCDFCEQPIDRCECDSSGATLVTLTDFGRATVYDPHTLVLSA